MPTMADKIERGREHAAVALAAYRAAHTPGRAADPDDTTAVGDLIADLLHLLDSIEVDGERDSADLIAFRAIDHYAYEVNPGHADEIV